MIPVKIELGKEIMKNSCSCSCSVQNGKPEEPFQLMQLPFAVDALEPYIDAQTVTIHHDKHHATYVANLNKAVAGNATLCQKSVCELLQDLDSVPAEIRNAVRNQGGGVGNHNFYWKILGKNNNGAKPIGELAAAIDKFFGSFTGFQEQLSKAAIGQFGSGWGWLVLAKDGSLKVKSTLNQDSPLSQGEKPLVTIDVWEHAYYLKYQNKRPEYVQAIWNLFNWDFISERYAKLLQEME